MTDKYINLAVEVLNEQDNSVTIDVELFPKLDVTVISFETQLLACKMLLSSSEHHLKIARDYIAELQNDKKEMQKEINKLKGQLQGIKTRLSWIVDGSNDETI